MARKGSDMSENDSDIFGNASLFENFLDTAASKPQPENDLDGQSETLDQIQEKIYELKQENNELRRQLRLLIHPGSLKASDSRDSAPIAQVLFFNHDAVCFHRHQIEDFFENLTAMTNEESGGCRVPDNARPKPQRSSRLLRNDLVGTMSSEAYTVTGNVQYYRGFCIDSLGRPLIDGNPQLTEGWDIPVYSVIFHEALPLDETEKPSQKRAKRNKATCWNCDKEDHSLRDCPFLLKPWNINLKSSDVKAVQTTRQAFEKTVSKPRDLVKISMAKKEFMEQNAENALLNQRYHKETEEGVEQRFAQFRPGQISDDLREALGLDKHQVPPYIYQMRLLGYPPGYLKKAEVLKSGLTVYDMKDGNEPGQIDNDQAESQTTYDPTKLIEFPGFNIPPPEGTREPHGVPPMQPAHSLNAFQSFMTPTRGPNSGKRERRDFMEDPHKKRPRMEREELDMDVEDTTPDVSSGQSTPLNFKPPLPPTPIPETPPPLPSSTPPATPGHTPRYTQVDTPSEYPAIKSPGEVSTDTECENVSQSSASRGTPRSMSPSMDDLELMQRSLREALLQAAEEGSSVLSDADSANERFLVGGQEFVIESVSGDDEEGTEDGAVEMDKETSEPSIPQDEDTQTLDEVGCEIRPLASEDTPTADTEASKQRTLEDTGHITEVDKAESSTSDKGESSTPVPEQSTEVAEEAIPSDEQIEAGNEADLEPGEIADADLDATPNRSGVPHISKFAVGISPHENENLSESTGMLKRIMGIFKRNKSKPSS